MFNSYLKAWSNALLATQVVTARLPIMCLAAVDPSPGRQREMELMVSEKQEALLDGMTAAYSVAFTTWSNMIVGRHVTLDGQALIQDCLDAFTLPAERILLANAQRLTGGA